MSVQDQPAILSHREASPHEVAGLGLALSLAGLYFMLGSIGVLPMPDVDGPSFLIFAAGIAFLFAGLLCFIRARTGMTDNQTTRPEASPGWIKLSYQTFGIGVLGAFATIGTWVAIGSGPHAFAVSSPLAMQTTGDLVGRTVFGLGAVIIWIGVIALTVSTVRKLLDRG
ncbi:hypothetical protein [Rhodoplanes sp. Z2-YC6860]|uniref:hypothetical protein n=1 Tax=Rhodoplanes sp. Z2-YC6860 TaxID=674703 RepID=UPI000829FC56|nr:hypothetical protein [Rhodoplanes sp. Z2-YC6860]